MYWINCRCNFVIVFWCTLKLMEPFQVSGWFPVIAVVLITIISLSQYVRILICDWLNICLTVCYSFLYWQSIFYLFFFISQINHSIAYANRQNAYNMMEKMRADIFLYYIEFKLAWMLQMMLWHCPNKWW